MDFGMKHFLTLSDGTTIDIPDYHRQALAESSKADRTYSVRRRSGVYGSSFRRAKKAKSKAHRKVADRRSDFHWKLAHELCRRYRFIAIEDLNLNAMKKLWGRKISSLGFSEFVEKLKCVAVKYGTEVVEIDRWYASSQTCSECGYKYGGTKDLNVREWDCPCCGAHHDRDVNAAKNILERGVKEYGEDVPHGGSGSKTSVGKSDCRSRDSVERPRHRLRIPRL
jgi:putative transposase